MQINFKTLFLIIALISNNICYGADILLPPVSLKQEQSVNKILDASKITQLQLTQQEKKKKPQAIQSIVQKLDNISINLGVAIDEGDLYMPLASTICLFMNKENSRSCKIFKYNNGVEAFKGLLNGDVDVLLTNALLGQFVISGREPFNKNAEYNKIRFISSFFSEILTILVKKNSQIKTLDDLKTASINISPQYTKTHIMMEYLMSIKNWQMQNFQSVLQVDLKSQMNALCSSNIQSMILIAEEGNQLVKDATRTCESVVINIPLEDINLLTKNLIYQPYTIKGGTYIGMPFDVETVAIQAVLLTTLDTTNAQITFTLNTIKKYLNEIQSFDPAFTNITLKTMFDTSKIAPLHEAVNIFLTTNQ